MRVTVYQFESVADAPITFKHLLEFPATLALMPRVTEVARNQMSCIRTTELPEASKRKSLKLQWEMHLN
jgi:hypothetical protein